MNLLEEAHVFFNIKHHLLSLIDKLRNNYPELPLPEIISYLPDDPCDFTSPSEIRIKPVDDCDVKYHATHVFGHWICDLHTEDKYCDTIADIVSSWFVREGF